MRSSATVLVTAVAILTACSTSPESFVSRTPEPIGDAFSCALRQVNALGFVVQNTDRDGGFLTAEKKSSGLGTAILTGKEFFDVLTVSVFESGEAENTIRVTAARAEQGAINLFGDASRSSGQKPSEEGRAAARQILETCGEGPVTQQQTSAAFVIEQRALLAP